MIRDMTEDAPDELYDDDVYAPDDDYADAEPEPEPVANVPVSGAALTGALESLTVQLEDAMARVGDLRSDVEKLDQQLVRTQRRHNALIDELVDFRDAAASSPLAGAIDDLLGDDIWHYDI